MPQIHLTDDELAMVTGGSDPLGSLKDTVEEIRKWLTGGHRAKA